MLDIKLIDYEDGITNADDDAGSDDEVETITGDELDSLAKAALECVGRKSYISW